MGGLARGSQVGLASCPVSGVGSFSFLPAPFESCRFSLQEGGNTPPGQNTRWAKGEAVTIPITP